MCQCIIFFLDCKVVVSIFCLSPGVDAATIILAVEVVFMREFYRAFIAVFLFEIRWKMLYMLDFCQFFSDFINLGSILEWAD